MSVFLGTLLKSRFGARAVHWFGKEVGVIRTRAKAGGHRPMLAECGPNVAESGPEAPSKCRKTDLGPTWPGTDPNFGRRSTKSRFTWPGIDHIGEHQDRLRPMLHRVRPLSAETSCPGWGQSVDVYRVGPGGAGWDDMTQKVVDEQRGDAPFWPTERDGGSSSRCSSSMSCACQRCRISRWGQAASSYERWHRSLKPGIQNTLFAQDYG